MSGLVNNLKFSMFLAQGYVFKSAQVLWSTFMSILVILQCKRKSKERKVQKKRATNYIPPKFFFCFHWKKKKAIKVTESFLNELPKKKYIYIN